MNVIQLNCIQKKYGTHVIFENFNLAIQQDDLVAVIGDSGSGKSTLLNIIGLLEKPDGGDIEIAGVKNPSINGHHALLLQRNTIGYLFQNYALVDNMTVDKNLDIALEYVKIKDKQQAKLDVLKQVGLADKLKNKIYELSGGEQQRVAIARLMLKPCEIILADEPTGSLDVNHRDIVIDLLKNLHTQGKTVVIVTHDHHVADVCNRVVNIG